MHHQMDLIIENKLPTMYGGYARWEVGCGSAGQIAF